MALSKAFKNLEILTEPQNNSGGKGPREVQIPAQGRANSQFRPGYRWQKERVKIIIRPSDDFLKNHPH